MTTWIETTSQPARQGACGDRPQLEIETLVRDNFPAEIVASNNGSISPGMPEAVDNPVFNMKPNALIDRAQTVVSCQYSLPPRERKLMVYQIFRVEITRDETRAAEPVSIEITAYIDRMPETDEAAVGRLSRLAAYGTAACNTPAISRHWRTRLPRLWQPIRRPTASAVTNIRVDNEFPVEVPPLVRSGENWLPDV